MDLLAQAGAGLNFWNAPSGSAELIIKIVLALVLSGAFFFGLIAAPANLRRPIVGVFTFLAGLFYVTYWLWPSAIARDPGQAPLNPVEGVAFWLEDALPQVANFSNILTAFLLGLGVYSVARIHVGKLVKRQRDWEFSLVLIASMLLMILFGYWNWFNRHSPTGGLLEDPANWHFQQFASDMLFDGLLQQMDAAMFSMIAFYILSAAYRAFRIRSVEATILLAAALIVMLSLMGAVAYKWGNNSFIQTHPNLSLEAIAGWLSDNVQTPSIRGIDFGVGIGSLAMGLRIWLNLERQEAS